MCRNLLIAGFAMLGLAVCCFGYKSYVDEQPVPTVAPDLSDDLYNASNNLFKRGRRDRNEVCLTIDDGPHPQSLPRILDILKEFDVKATFFMVGKRMREHPDEVREVLREGHEIGNHSENHNRLDLLTADQIRAELSLCEGNFAQATGGTKMTLFRPPGMRFSPAVAKVAKEFGYTTILANYGAKDFHFGDYGPTIADEDKIVQYILDNVTPGGIILLHDAPETADALPAILAGLKKKGLAVVNVTEMLEHLPKPVLVESNAGRIGKLAMK